MGGELKYAIALNDNTPNKHVMLLERVGEILTLAHILYCRSLHLTERAFSLGAESSTSCERVLVGVRHILSNIDESDPLDNARPPKWSTLVEKVLEDAMTTRCLAGKASIHIRKIIGIGSALECHPISLASVTELSIAEMINLVQSLDSELQLISNMAGDGDQIISRAKASMSSLLPLLVDNLTTSSKVVAAIELVWKQCTEFIRIIEERKIIFRDG